MSIIGSIFEEIFESIGAVLVGILLILGMICLLFFNEVRPNDATAAKLATQLTTENAAQMQGQPVWYKGKLNGSLVTDSEFLQPSDYIVLERIVETYAWVENERREDDEVRYTYEKKWVTTVPNSNSFYYQSGHENVEKRVNSKSGVSQDLLIDSYKLSSDISFASALTTLTPNALNTVGNHNFNGVYLYLNDNVGTINGPQIGDCRIKFNYISNQTEGIVLAQLEGDSLVKLNYLSEGVIKMEGTVYRFFRETNIQSVIRLLEREHRVLLWVLRAIGFVFMFGGFALVFSPLDIVTGFLPFVNRMTRGIATLFSLVASLIISMVVIVAANILNNIITLLLLIGLVIGLIVFGARRAKNNSRA